MPADKKEVLKALQSQIDEIMAAPSGSIAKGLSDPWNSISSGSSSGLPSNALAEEGGLNSAGQSSSSFDCLTAAGRKAFMRLQDLCSYSEYSAHKMRSRLIREEFSPEASCEAVDYALQLNLINDQRYAEALISTRLRAGKGQVAIERDLLSHEIDPSSVPGWPEAYWERWGTEEDRARRDLSHHPSRSKNPTASSYRRLLSRGFSPAVSRQVVTEVYGL